MRVAQPVLLFPFCMQDMFCAIGVCKSWRAAGHALFFKDSWGSGVQTPSGPAIQHPAQLITLVRRHIEPLLVFDVVGL
jgi:hypothetical protein